MMRTCHYKFVRSTPIDADDGRSGSTSRGDASSVSKMVDDITVHHASKRLNSKSGVRVDQCVKFNYLRAEPKPKPEQP